MTYYYGNVKCPHCNTVYYRYAGKTTKFPGYGSPVRLCPKCQQYFIWTDYKETVISEYNNAAEYEKEPTVLGSFLGAVFCIAIAFIIFNALHSNDSALYTAIAIILAVVGIYLLIRGIYVKFNIEKIKIGIKERRDKRIEEVEAKYSGRGTRKLTDAEAQSLSRLSNPNYVRYLESIGVVVPTFFKKRIGYNDTPSKEETVEFLNYVIMNRYPVSDRIKRLADKCIESKDEEIKENSGKTIIDRWWKCSKCQTRFEEDFEACPNCGEIGTLEYYEIKE